MLKKIVSKIEKHVEIPKAYAHCDIPCGIYDPYIAQYNAHTVLRMIHLINSLDKNDPEFHHKLIRYTITKEEYAEKVKHEIRILWGDYFKPDHAKEFPELQDLVWKVMQTASKSRQLISEEKAKELLKMVQQIAVIFWKTKGKQTQEVMAPYPTGETIIIPKYDN